MTATHPLRVFLCHASEDKPAVRVLYKSLKAESWIAPWLDEEELEPGQDWNLEINKALRGMDAILICLSTKSVSKEGYVQKEFKLARDLADEKPDGTIYIIPLRLDGCQIPQKFKQWQWVDYFDPNGYKKLLKSLRKRLDGLQPKPRQVISEPDLSKSLPYTKEDLDLYRFIEIRAAPERPSPFWIGKYPVTNAQYARFLDETDFVKEDFWKGFLKFNKDCIQIGRWKDEGLEWLQKESDGERIEPRFWSDDKFGNRNPENPVVGITWYEANAYCNWLCSHWQELTESRATPSLRPRLVRLPLELEWLTAAGGDKPWGRYPWDAPRRATSDKEEIVRRANVAESKIGHTTAVNAYLYGSAPFGVMALAGNVWEWQANYHGVKEGWLALRGGSWFSSREFARVSFRGGFRPQFRDNVVGFRVVALQSEA